MKSAVFISSKVDPTELPRYDRPQVAVVGRSNVGKSSLINHLTGQNKLARVSSAPGRTQTINLYEIDKTFYLVDLPGYGYAKKIQAHRAMFAKMISDYLRDTAQLRLVLLMIDARIPLTDLDTNTLEWLGNNHIPFVIIMNKIDKVSAADALTLNQTLEEKYPGIHRIAHSINSGKNRSEIWEVMEKAVRHPRTRQSH